MHNETIPEEEPDTVKGNPTDQGTRHFEKGHATDQGTRHSEKRKPPRGKSPPHVAPGHAQGLDTNVPVTMRSSFVLGVNDL